VGFELPFDPRQALGRVRAPVRVTINAHTFRTTVASMHGRVFIGLSREVREAASVTAGDRVVVGLELDREPRRVDLPADLAASLTASERAAFESLAYTRRKEHVRYVEEARGDATRRTRIEKTAELLRGRADVHPSALRSAGVTPERRAARAPTTRGTSG
jgi:hypothetical protein